MRSHLAAAAAILTLAACSSNADGTTVAPSCLKALDSADLAHQYAATGFEYTRQFADITSQGWDAASRFDSAGINASTEQVYEISRKLKDLTPLLAAAIDDYNSAAQICRAAAHQ